MGDIAVDIFLETLNQLITSSEVDSIIKEGHQLKYLEKEIKCMKGFLKDTEKKRNEHSEVMNLVRQIKDAVSEAENTIELFVVQAFMHKHAPSFFRQPQDHLSLDLESVKKEIKSLTAEVKQFYVQNMCAIYGVAGNFFSRSEGGSSLSGGRNTFKVAKEKVVVGFKEELETLLEKLQDRGDGGRRVIISIVGVAGGGKTTLAREVYDDPLMSHTFEIRAWLNVSQAYDNTMKRNLLIAILEIASPKKQGDYEMSSEDKLGEDTHKCLKGKKYLIVIDDIWDIESWNDIQKSLPNDFNGSKVLITSRLPVEPKGIHCIPHFLAPLPQSCSWELLQNKVFGKKCCPPELVGIGEHIAEKCEGLPLAIVAIAGILAVEDKTPNVWEQVSISLSSIIANKQDNCLEKLELSYNHLPLHLKACFVYIGGFPEDSEILVRELIWLWIAEGFIQQSEGDLEAVAKDYLRSLIDRNLVMVARSFGGIKACRIHDLLRELCLKKAEEDNFLVRIYGDDTFSDFAANKHRRLFISSQFFQKFSSRPCPPSPLTPGKIPPSPQPPSKNGPSAPSSTQILRSFLCLSNSSHSSFETNLSFFAKNFELLRVLHFFYAECRAIIVRGHLVHLRYLALQLPSYTSDFELPFPYLLNLETLNLKSIQWFQKPINILLPRDIHKMVKLRHLYAKRGVFKYHFSCLYPDIAAEIGFDHWSKLDSLQTLHPICPCEECRNFLARTCEECRNFLVRTPNLRKLGFYGDLISNDLVLMLPDLEFLKCLETLSFNHSNTTYKANTLPPVLKFPPTVGGAINPPNPAEP